MKILSIILVIIGMATWGFAEELQILKYQTDENRSPLFDSSFNAPDDAKWKVSVSDEILDVPLSGQTVLNLPGQITYEITHDNKMIHKNGNITWVGYLSNFGTRYRVIITQGRGHAFGLFHTPEGDYKIRSDPSGTWLIDVEAAGLIPGQYNDDYLIPPNPEKKLKPKRQTNQIETQAAGTVIDVMVIYTPSFAAQFSGDGLQTRLDNLVDLANQAFVDSQIDTEYRLVHSELVQYTTANTNVDALTDITDGNSPFENLAALRTQKGADLVVLIRRYDTQSQNSCGNGWLNGFNGNDISLYSNNGYSVVSDGDDANTPTGFCSDYAFAHELGHNLGSTHDRPNATDQGAYPYSYGHGMAGVFGTIMSYINPEIGYFSNPDISSCNGNACGIDENDQNSANNALSINNTRSAVAAFMQATVADSYRYYLPYFRAHTNHWTAVGVKNLSRSQKANVTVTVYNQTGVIKVVVNKEVDPFGQSNFTVGNGEPDEGWILVESDQPLVGLCFFATTGTPNFMADIAFMDQLFQELHVPLVGQGPVFDTTLYVCNPNDTAATATVRFYDKTGTNLYTVNQQIPANGSWVYSLGNMVADSSIANPGSLEITGDQPLRAFVGYDNTKTADGTMVAGINADPA
ncbi:MAG: hypothetical protein JRH15_00320 [Deltaproteobacteria bacterium]|nr:hypothetical protein [Deltaproteobacteria bacterium]